MISSEDSSTSKKIWNGPWEACCRGWPIVARGKTCFFAGIGHYGEERLGISRTTAEDRSRLARALRRFPILSQAYERGDVGFESALLVLRVLGGGPVEAEVEKAWVERAREATVKRVGLPPPSRMGGRLSRKVGLRNEPAILKRAG